MSTFEYTATSPSGEHIHGIVRARDKNDAVLRISDKFSMIDDIHEVESGKKSILSIELFKKKISEKTLSLLCKQFSIILSAGLPIVRSIELVSHQAEDKTLRELLQQVAEDTAAGYGLAESFAMRGPSLPPTFIETIRAGEMSGSLSIAFERLSDFYAKKSKTQGKVISALTYPAFVLIVAVIVITIIMVKAVPQFTTTFVSLGLDLPFPTRALIALSNFFSRWTWLIALIIILAIIGIKIYSSTEKGSQNLAKIILKLPVFGKISLTNAASQFAGTFSTMMAAGLPAVNALSITGRSLSNAYLSQAVEDAVKNVESGFHIGDSMRETNLFPDLLVEMTSIGEESGSIEETLTVIREYYDNEVETLTGRAVSLLEPMIIVVLAVFVVFVLLAVYMPMFSMYGTIS